MPNENRENFESGIDKEIKKLRKFIYRDHSAGGKIIFECTAKGILEADKMYKEVTSKDVEKQGHVGCSYEEIKTNIDA